MKNLTCPGCGAGYNGRRCRRCGYSPFPDSAGRPVKTDAPAPGKKRKKHPLLGFLILLLLIWAMLPVLRRWGQRLEAIEDAAQSSGYHSREVEHG